MISPSREMMATFPFFSLVSLLSLLVSLSTIVAAAPCTTERPCNAFTVRAFRGGSVINGQPIHANNFGLWIGKHTKTSCPRYIKQCPTFTKTITAFYCIDKTGAPTTCGMSIIIPQGDGERLYVDPADGVIHYSYPGGFLPPTAIAEGFQYKLGVNGQPGIFQFIGNSSEGLIACPTHPERRYCNHETGRHCGPWSIRAALPGLDQSNCVLIGGVTTITNEYAWQYN